MSVPPPPVYVFDCETYQNYFLVMARNALMPGAAPRIVYERFNDQVLVDEILPQGTLIGFNSRNYDLPMVAYMRAGASNAALKALSDAIITRNLKPWDAEREFGFEPLVVDHIDLIEVAPGTASLKSYGGRLHSQRLQDLPIEPSAIIDEAQRQQLIAYCGNDLQTTIDLYVKLQPQLSLREQMGREFGIDLRSKSDAQIAEAVIRSEVEKRIGQRVYRAELDLSYEFTYRAPPWVQFQTPGMQHVLHVIHAQRFGLLRQATKDRGVGSVVMPPQLDGLRLRIGRGVYRMGIGGLHSSESCIRHVSEGDAVILDRDVTSYYPALIINAGIAPSSLGVHFQTVYRDLVKRRIDAKHAGNKVMADALKICVNGTFGKLGSIYSVMYAPDQLVTVTLTGQLALLMLIESLEQSGIEVLSANTDGVVSRVRAHQRDLFNALVAAWELQTGLATEETEYRALYAKDVNNYIAVKADGGVKLKGLYAEAGLQKNATNSICVEAAIAQITHGTPVEHTVRACSDVRKFLTLRKVDGGATYDGAYLGRVVRWYYARGETRHIAYKTNGNKVARSDGARPLMELPAHIPSDIDRQWYIAEAQSILGDVGL